jgi:hypothetical protein
MLVLDSLQVSLKQSGRAITCETLINDEIFATDVKTRMENDENIPICYNVKTGVVRSPQEAELIYCYDFKTRLLKSVAKHTIMSDEIDAECEATYKNYLVDEAISRYPDWNSLVVFAPELANQIRSHVLVQMDAKSEKLGAANNVVSDFQKQVLSALAGHQVEGKQIVQGLKAAGLDNVPDIKDNYLGGWLNIDCTIEQFIRQLATA